MKVIISLDNMFVVDLPEDSIHDETVLKQKFLEAFKQNIDDMCICVEEHLD